MEAAAGSSSARGARESVPMLHAPCSTLDGISRCASVRPRACRPSPPHSPNSPCPSTSVLHRCVSVTRRASTASEDPEQLQRRRQLQQLEPRDEMQRIHYECAFVQLVQDQIHRFDDSWRQWGAIEGRCGPSCSYNSQSSWNTRGLQYNGNHQPTDHQDYCYVMSYEEEHYHPPVSIDSSTTELECGVWEAVDWCPHINPSYNKMNMTLQNNNYHMIQQSASLYSNDFSQTKIARHELPISYNEGMQREREAYVSAISNNEIIFNRVDHDVSNKFRNNLPSQIENYLEWRDNTSSEMISRDQNKNLLINDDNKEELLKLNISEKVSPRKKDRNFSPEVTQLYKSRYNHEKSESSDTVSTNSVQLILPAKNQPNECCPRHNQIQKIYSSNNYRVNENLGMKRNIDSNRVSEHADTIVNNKHKMRDKKRKKLDIIAMQNNDLKNETSKLNDSQSDNASDMSTVHDSERKETKHIAKRTGNDCGSVYHHKVPLICQPEEVHYEMFKNPESSQSCCTGMLWNTQEEDYVQGTGNEEVTLTNITIQDSQQSTKLLDSELNTLHTEVENERRYVHKSNEDESSLIHCDTKKEECEQDNIEDTTSGWTQTVSICTRNSQNGQLGDKDFREGELHKNENFLSDEESRTESSCIYKECKEQNLSDDEISRQRQPPCWEERSLTLIDKTDSSSILNEVQVQQTSIKSKCTSGQNLVQEEIKFSKHQKAGKLKEKNKENKTSSSLPELKFLSKNIEKSEILSRNLMTKSDQHTQSGVRRSADVNYKLQISNSDKLQETDSDKVDRESAQFLQVIDQQNTNKVILTEHESLSSSTNSETEKCIFSAALNQGINKSKYKDHNDKHLHQEIENEVSVIWHRKINSKTIYKRKSTGGRESPNKSGKELNKIGSYNHAEWELHNISYEYEKEKSNQKAQTLNRELKKVQTHQELQNEHSRLKNCGHSPEFTENEGFKVNKESGMKDNNFDTLPRTIKDEYGILERNCFALENKPTCHSKNVSFENINIESKNKYEHCSSSSNTVNNKSHDSAAYIPTIDVLYKTLPTHNETLIKSPPCKMRTPYSVVYKIPSVSTKVERKAKRKTRSNGDSTIAISETVKYHLPKETDYITSSIISKVTNVGKVGMQVSTKDYRKQKSCKRTPLIVATMKNPSNTGFLKNVKNSKPKSKHSQVSKRNLSDKQVSHTKIHNKDTVNIQNPEHLHHAQTPEIDEQNKDSNSKNNISSIEQTICTLQPKDGNGATDATASDVKMFPIRQAPHNESKEEKEAQLLIGIGHEEEPQATIPEWKETEGNCQEKQINAAIHFPMKSLVHDEELAVKENSSFELIQCLEKEMEIDKSENISLLKKMDTSRSSKRKSRNAINENEKCNENMQDSSTVSILENERVNLVHDVAMSGKINICEINEKHSSIPQKIQNNQVVEEHVFHKEILPFPFTTFDNVNISRISRKAEQETFKFKQNTKIPANLMHTDNKETSFPSRKKKMNAVRFSKERKLERKNLHQLKSKITSIQKPGLNNISINWLDISCRKSGIMQKQVPFSRKRLSNRNKLPETKRSVLYEKVSRTKLYPKTLQTPSKAEQTQTKKLSSIKDNVTVSSAPKNKTTEECRDEEINQKDLGNSVQVKNELTTLKSIFQKELDDTLFSNIMKNISTSNFQKLQNNNEEKETQTEGNGCTCFEKSNQKYISVHFAERLCITDRKDKKYSQNKEFNENIKCTGPSTENVKNDSMEFYDSETIISSKDIHHITKQDSTKTTTHKYNRHTDLISVGVNDDFQSSEHQATSHSTNEIQGDKCNSTVILKEIEHSKCIEKVESSPVPQRIMKERTYYEALHRENTFASSIRKESCFSDNSFGEKGNNTLQTLCEKKKTFEVASNKTYFEYENEGYMEPNKEMSATICNKEPNIVKHSTKVNILPRVQEESEYSSSSGKEEKERIFSHTQTSSFCDDSVKRILTQSSRKAGYLCEEQLEHGVETSKQYKSTIAHSLFQPASELSSLSISTNPLSKNTESYASQPCTMTSVPSPCPVTEQNITSDAPAYREEVDPEDVNNSFTEYNQNEIMTNLIEHISSLPSQVTTHNANNLSYKCADSFSTLRQTLVHVAKSLLNENAIESSNTENKFELECIKYEDIPHTKIKILKEVAKQLLTGELQPEQLLSNVESIHKNELETFKESSHQFKQTSQNCFSTENIIPISEERVLTNENVHKYEHFSTVVNHKNSLQSEALKHVAKNLMNQEWKEEQIDDYSESEATSINPVLKTKQALLRAAKIIFSEDDILNTTEPICETHKKAYKYTHFEDIPLVKINILKEIARELLLQGVVSEPQARILPSHEGNGNKPYPQLNSEPLRTGVINSSKRQTTGEMKTNDLEKSFENKDISVTDISLTDKLKRIVGAFFSNFMAGAKGDFLPSPIQEYFNQDTMDLPSFHKNIALNRESNSEDTVLLSELGIEKKKKCIPSFLYKTFHPPLTSNHKECSYHREYVVAHVSPNQKSVSSTSTPFSEAVTNRCQEVYTDMLTSNREIVPALQEQNVFSVRNNESKVISDHSKTKLVLHFHTKACDDSISQTWEHTTSRTQAVCPNNVYSSDATSEAQQFQRAQIINKEQESNQKTHFIVYVNPCYLPIHNKHSISNETTNSDINVSSQNLAEQSISCNSHCSTIMDTNGNIIPLENNDNTNYNHSIVVHIPQNSSVQKVDGQNVEAIIPSIAGINIDIGITTSVPNSSTYCPSERYSKCPTEYIVHTTSNQHLESTKHIIARICFQCPPKPTDESESLKKEENKKRRQGIKEKEAIISSLIDQFIETIFSDTNSSEKLIIFNVIENLITEVSVDDENSNLNKIPIFCILESFIAELPESLEVEQMCSHVENFLKVVSENEEKHSSEKLPMPELLDKSLLHVYAGLDSEKTPKIMSSLHEKKILDKQLVSPEVEDFVSNLSKVLRFTPRERKVMSSLVDTFVHKIQTKLKFPQKSHLENENIQETTVQTLFPQQEKYVSKVYVRNKGELSKELSILDSEHSPQNITGSRSAQILLSERQFPSPVGEHDTDGIIVNFEVESCKSTPSLNEKFLEEVAKAESAEIGPAIISMIKRFVDEVSRNINILPGEKEAVTSLIEKYVGKIIVALNHEQTRDNIGECKMGSTDKRTCRFKKKKKIHDSFEDFLSLCNFMSPETHFHNSTWRLILLFMLLLFIPLMMFLGAIMALGLCHTQFWSNYWPTFLTPRFLPKDSSITVHDVF